jgi:hypothetical protein
LASLDEDGLEFDERCCTMSSPAVDDPDIAPKLDPAVPPEASRRSNRAARAGRLLLTAAHEHEAGAARAGGSIYGGRARARDGRRRERGTTATTGGDRPKQRGRKCRPFVPRAGGLLDAASGGGGPERSGGAVERRGMWRRLGLRSSARPETEAQAQHLPPLFPSVPLRFHCHSLPIFALPLLL